MRQYWFPVSPGLPDGIRAQLESIVAFQNEATFLDLFSILEQWFRQSGKPIVLISDEIDNVSNNQVFLDFLGKLLSNFLKRAAYPNYKTFQSVILSGVTDVKHLRTKIRDEDQHKTNSPWNIASNFTLDMSLSEIGIQGMLDQYASDHRTGMNSMAIAKQIRDHTSGSPFLVSRICQTSMRAPPLRLPDVNGAWTISGVEEVVKRLLKEDNTLFQSLTGNLTNYPELKEAIRSILMSGACLTFNAGRNPFGKWQCMALSKKPKGRFKSSTA